MPEQRGAFAEAARAREEQLVQRLATSVAADRAFQAVLRAACQHNVQSRQRLDALEAEIRQAAATWPALNTPAGARQFQAYLTGKTRQIHQVVADAAADSQQRAAQVQALTGRYPVGSGQRSASETDSTGRGHEGERAEMVGFGSHMPRTPPLKPDSPDPSPPPKNPTAEHPLPGLPTDLGGRPVGEGVRYRRQNSARFGCRRKLQTPATNRLIPMLRTGHRQSGCRHYLTLWGLDTPEVNKSK